MSSTDWAAGQSAPPPPPGPRVSAAPPGSLASQLWSSSKPWPRLVGRGALFVLLGAAVTSMLSMFMYSLIKFRQVSMDEDTGFKNANFIRLKEETNVNRRKRELPKKKQREKQPETPTLAVQVSKQRKIDTTALKIDIPDAPTFSGKINLMGSAGMVKGSVIRDQGRMPFAFVKPIYPPEAQDRGIEGWVRLKFTVTKNGSVTNPRVIKAEPPSVFNRAAIDCVKKWKYRPKVVDGQAVEEHGVEGIVRFNLNDN